MPSSGSTRSRSPERAIPLYLWFADEDHPKACTGRRLLRAGLVEAVSAGRTPPEGILLDPHAALPLSTADRSQSRAGVVAVDCSWNRLGERGRYPSGPLDRIPATRRRRLPWLLAGNPHHFGRVGELNTAEALAAALTVLGSEPPARELLHRIGSGDSFFQLNAERLRAYASAVGAEGVRAAELRFFGP